MRRIIHKSTLFPTTHRKDEIKSSQVRSLVDVLDRLQQKIGG